MTDSESRIRIDAPPSALMANTLPAPNISGVNHLADSARAAVAYAQSQYLAGRYELVKPTLEAALADLGRADASAGRESRKPSVDEDLLAGAMWTLIARAAFQTEGPSPAVSGAASHAAALFKALRDGGKSLSEDELGDFAIALYLAGDVEQAATVIKAGGLAGIATPEVQLYRGLIEAGSGHFALAVEALNNAAAVRGDRLAVLRLQTLGAAFESLKQMDEAARVLFELANVHHRAGKPAEALAIIEHLLTVAFQPHLVTAKGQLLLALGRHTEALETIEPLLKVDPWNPQTLIVKAQTLIALDRLPDAEEVLRGVIRRDPTNGQALATYGDALLKSAKLDEARDALTRALELDPENVVALSRRGEVFRLKGEPQAALSDFDNTLRLSPGNLWTISRRADALRMMGEYTQALEQFDVVLKGSPDDLLSLAGKGDTLRNIGQLKEAEATLTRALELSPAYRFGRVSLAQILQDQSRENEAIVLFESVLKDEPDHVQALEGASYALLRLDRIERGLTVVNHYLKLKPESAWGRAVYGAMLFQIRNYDEAIAQLAQSIEREKETAWVHSCYALSLMWKAVHDTPGDAAALFEAAHERATEAVRLEPKGTTWELVLAETLWRRPDPRRDEARPHYLQVLADTRSKAKWDFYEALDAGWSAFRLAFLEESDRGALLAEAERFSVEALTQKKDRPSSADAIEAKFNLAIAIICSGRAGLALREYTSALQIASAIEPAVRRGLIARARTQLQETIRDWPGSAEVPHTGTALKLLEEAYEGASSHESVISSHESVI